MNLIGIQFIQFCIKEMEDIMKLSIHIIYDRIISSDSYIIASKNVYFNLQGVRIYSESSSILSKDLIYIIKPNQLASITSDTNLNFICLGNIDKSLINDKWSIIILPSNDDVDDLLEKVQAIFEEYNEWISDINNSIFKEDSLQSILDKGSIYLKNPVALFDNLQGLLLKTSNLNLNNLDPIWSYVLNKGYSFKEAESDFLEQKVRKSHSPFYYISPGRFRDINRLIAPIMVKDLYFGVIAMTDLYSPISKSEYANLCLLQEIIENALKINNPYFSHSEAPWYMYQLINKNYVDHSVVSHHLGLRGRKVDDKYFLWCFSPSEKIIAENFNIQSYLHHISKLFESSIVFCHDNMILVCDYNLNNCEDKYFRDMVLDLLSRTGFRVSTSMVFSSIFEIGYAFNQCLITNDFYEKKDTQIISFNEIYFDYILTTIEKNTELDVLVTPKIRNLNPKDSYGRDLLLSLQAFITNGKSITSTAKTLNVHRHTVVYRLNNIKKITEIDFDKLDEDTMLQLYLSCRILLRNS
ncbi:MAG: PucR family transcriptional regulator [Firmicutes bacterium]|nr:PucR family transcriptional regulator [Bacillota bacterium]